MHIETYQFLKSINKKNVPKSFQNFTSNLYIFIYTRELWTNCVSSFQEFCFHRFTVAVGKKVYARLSSIMLFRILNIEYRLDRENLIRVIYYYIFKRIFGPKIGTIQKGAIISTLCFLRRLFRRRRYIFLCFERERTDRKKNYDRFASFESILRRISSNSGTK